MRWLRQLLERALCALFCSRRSQAGWQQTRGQASALPVAWPRSRWACFSVSLSADTLACQHAGPPCTRGAVPLGAPLHSCCLCGHQPVPLLCMGHPSPSHPRVQCVEQNLSGLSPTLRPCAREGPLRTEGLGRALLPSLVLRPPALEMELRPHTEVPFVYCSQRTGKPGGRGWHCLGRVVLISAGLLEQGRDPWQVWVHTGRACCPMHPETRRYLSLRI